MPTVERIEDRWILVRLDRTLREVTRSLESYEFAQAVKSIYAFAWNELCDWYLESVKGRLRSDDEVERADATRTLSFVLDRTIRVLHPVMPHLTEQLAQQVWGEHGGGIDNGRLVAHAARGRALPSRGTPSGDAGYRGGWACRMRSWIRPRRMRSSQADPPGHPDPRGARRRWIPGT